MNRNRSEHDAAAGLAEGLANASRARAAQARAIAAQDRAIARKRRAERIYAALYWLAFVGVGAFAFHVLTK